MWCKSCDKEGQDPQLLDIDGVLASVSGATDVCWGHSHEDDWWPCQRKAAEEHAKIQRLQTDQDLLVRHFREVDTFEGQCGNLDNATPAESAIRVMVERKARIDQLRTERNAWKLKWETTETARVNAVADVERDVSEVLPKTKEEVNDGGLRG